MKRASYFEKLKDTTVQCKLCPWRCIIKNNERGKCRVRENKEGVLYSLVYNKPCSLHIDPIEKKPLYHFLPGSISLSVGTAGCNLQCKFCQNWSISQADPEKVPFTEMTAEQIVEEAEKNKCKSISYTYTEPTIFYEFVLEIAKLAHKKGIKNVMVTNAFINKAPLKELYRYIDAVNIDFKSITDKFYHDLCGVPIGPVLDAIKEIKGMGIWIELTLLLIPGFNDSPDEIKKQCEWIVNNVGKDAPFHISRFYPQYKMMDTAPTSMQKLEQAYEIAKGAGLNYVYIGNVVTEKGNTYCARCGNLLIERTGFAVSETKLKNKKCNCGQEIPGLWE
jgi:pyruvate formate lyase activating enzyme